MQPSKVQRSSFHLLICLLVVGCADISSSGSTVTVRDSAGIRIVENGLMGSGPAPWRLSNEPLLRVGWEAKEPTFIDLSAGAILSDGRAVVGEWDGSRIYLIGRDGAVEAEVGRKGEGPGEYENISFVGVLPGDSILLQDDRNFRATVLGPRGEYDRDFRLVARRETFVDHIIGVSPTQHLVLWPGGWIPSRTESGWVESPLLRVSPDGLQSDTIAILRYSHDYGSGPIDPFAPFSQVAVGSGLVLYGWSDRPEITWLDERGATLQLSRWAPERKSVDDRVWEEYSTAYLSRISDSARARGILSETRRVASDALPFFGFMFADMEGNAWVGEYTFLGIRKPRYTVILRDGTRIGWVDVPEGFKILNIGTDRILGIEKDDMDVQAVSVYLINKE